VIAWQGRGRGRLQQHLAGSPASAAALSINNQLKVATAEATETATMTAMTMTMETKAMAALCGGKGDPAVMPIWRHYDANNTLLGIFVLAYSATATCALPKLSGGASSR